MKRLYLIFALLILALAACGSDSTQAPVPTAQPTRAATHAPTPTIVPTKKPAPTPTHQPTQIEQRAITFTLADSGNFAIHTLQVQAVTITGLYSSAIYTN